MSSTKAQLKAAGEAIKAKKWDEAIQLAQSVIAKDTQNYQAHLFLGFAQTAKNALPAAQATFTAAAELKPQDPQAWQGLIRVYERLGQASLPAYREAATHLVQIFAAQDDVVKAGDVVTKFLDFARAQGTRLQLVDALGIILPASDGGLYEVLERRVPVAHPAKTYEEIAQILESEEKRMINTLIGERRTRIGARLGDVTAEVKREILGASRLGDVYRGAIVWTRDDEIRRNYEEKLLSHSYDRLLAFAPGSDAKTAELRVVRKLARDMVIIKHPFKLAWDITIDWNDFATLDEWDFDMLKDYCAFFPASDLTKVLIGYLTSDISYFPKLESLEELPSQRREAKEATEEEDESEDDDDGGGASTSFIPVTEEDRLLMMTDGITTADSLLGYRLMSEYYKQLGEHESNVELLRKALDFLNTMRTKTGLALDYYGINYNLTLGISLVYWQSPRHHQEAKALFDAVLVRDPLMMTALIGIGLIYVEEEDYDAAHNFLQRALERDPTGLRVRAEAAWVIALKGDYAAARPELERCIPLMEEAGKTKAAKELLAETQYRLGVCIWNVDTSKAARKDRKEGSAYALWLAALKNNLSLAPAYTSLGVFYADYARDGKRARRCFQRAVELSASEVVAAERLARSFANEADWERVELVARRVVDSGKVRPPPGSKRKGIGWPFAALGVAELNKQEHAAAIVSFQAALRIVPEDFDAWVGLGESYYASGRYVAARKALVNALKLAEKKEGEVNGTWFANFMLANVKRELGEFDEAEALYQQVLKTRPEEDGVTMALMQTMVENALDSLEKGLFGKAIKLASDTIVFAHEKTASHLRETFNLWKAVGESCSVFSSIQNRAADLPKEALQSLLGGDDSIPDYQHLKETDGVGTGVIFAKGLFSDDETLGVDLTRAIHGAILAHKRAIHSASNDVHAQAVSYYNLGWAEYRAHSCLVLSSTKSAQPSHRKSSRYLKAAIRCFKRAIELEAGNADFWNALGVATSDVNPRVAQHAFSRSLYLDERSVQAWTNLGVLALSSGDAELANEAFTRAQSTDPDYAAAWLGQGFVALLAGHVKEARGLFTHAFGLAGAESVASRKLYPVSLFDQLIGTEKAISGGRGEGGSAVTVTHMMQAVFALGQLVALRPADLAYAHLGTLFQERIGVDRARAVKTLEEMAETLEAEYEASESKMALKQFIMAKTELSRSYLATRKYEEALESGQLVLDMTGEVDDELTSEERRKVRLSTHLTLGLAQYHLNQVDEAVNLLDTALKESDHNPDTVCLLAEILWATRDEEQRERARSILWKVVEKDPSHAQSVVLLGVISLLDDDAETREAVTSELQTLQSSTASETSQAQIGDVLLAMAALGTDASADHQEQMVISQAQTDIMLHPAMPHGWAELADASGETEPAEMALDVALKAVPPRGTLGAKALASAYAGTRRITDAQTAVVVAPWEKDGWEAMADGLSQ